MGEFGASDHADLDSKIKFLTFYREQAEQIDIFHGQFGATLWVSSIYDKDARKWREGVLNALVPAG